MVATVSAQWNYLSHFGLEPFVIFIVTLVRVIIMHLLIFTQHPTPFVVTSSHIFESKLLGTMQFVEASSPH